MSIKPKLYIICGPTASSKSAYAMKTAAKIGGAIINADSMQIYKEIPIITASPSKADKSQIPHYLYNHISIKSEYSVAKYLKEALGAVKDSVEKGLVPIIVGGTGLYISSLLKGLSTIPDIETQLRAQIRDDFEMMGKEVFYQRLIMLDPNSVKIKSGDSQRMIRAYEVLTQTGKPISYYQNIVTPSPLKDYDVETIMISPEREFLYKCCDERFIGLVANGGLEEVKNLYEQNLTAPKALGIAELSNYLSGSISLQEAVKLTQIKTRQYAKRQITWFNNQIKDKTIINSINR